MASPTPGAFAASLVSILPLRALVGQGEAERIALAVARLALRNFPEVGTGPRYIQLVREEQLMYRAAYARAAARRLVDAAQEDGTLDRALAVEDGYFAAHERRNRRREERGLAVSRAMDLYGETVGWYATIRPTSRPHHRAAHHHNWQPLLGAPLQTGSIPGELEHCLCRVGPPIQGARLLR